jgi:endonuclease/exonuclease/phosphatase family metal-dependent hydrolase
MFGMNGRSLISSIRGHLAVHRQKDPEKAYRKADLGGTCELIRKANADIIGVSEIICGQEEELRKILSLNGYNCFFGNGHRTKKNGLFLKVMVASKYPFEKISNSGFPVLNKMGGGGGFAHIYVPGLDSDILGIHLSNGRNPRKKDIYFKQLDFLRDYISGLDRRVILMGDFNGTSEDILEYLPEMNLASNKLETCSLTVPFNLFFNEPIDHIFTKGYTVRRRGTMEGMSDHRMVYVDFR